jgi:hypothetical protein
MRCPEVQLGCENLKNSSVSGLTAAVPKLTGTAALECAIVAAGFYVRGAMTRSPHPDHQKKCLSAPYSLD